MRIYLTFIITICFVNLLAQSLSKINYQGLVRDASGIPIKWLTKISTFKKPYTYIPVVQLTPNTHLQGLEFTVTNVTTNAFSILAYMTAGAGFHSIVNTSTFSFTHWLLKQ